MGVFQLFGIGWSFVKELPENIELLQQAWHFVTYHRRIAKKRKVLGKKLESLGCQEDDICQRLEYEEFRSGKKRKREVDDWIGNVQRVRNNEEDLEQQIGSGRYPLAPWLENSLDKIIEEVEELSKQGGSFEDLLLDVHQTRGEIFVTQALTRPDADPLVERIWTSLMSDEVQRIGIHGVEGVGKTAIMMLINNKLIENQRFDNVYWVTVSSELNIYKLQNEIAKLAGMNLSGEEDTRKRASKLYKCWGRKQCALFLDGLPNSFNEDEIGNPSECRGCKLIVSARQKRVCQSMCCHDTIEVEPLPDREAEMLFKRQLGPPSSYPPAVEEIARQIVQNYGGLPGEIIRTAKRMRGVDDIHEWKNILNELGGSEERFQ